MAKRFGYEIMPGWRMERLELAKYLRELFALYAIDWVRGAGANKAQCHDFLRQEVSYNKMIISCEAMLELSRFFQQRAGQDNAWYSFTCIFRRHIANWGAQIMANVEYRVTSPPVIGEVIPS